MKQEYLHILIQSFLKALLTCTSDKIAKCKICSCLLLKIYFGLYATVAMDCVNTLNAVGFSSKYKMFYILYSDLNHQL